MSTVSHSGASASDYRLHFHPHACSPDIPLPTMHNDSLLQLLSTSFISAGHCSKVLNSLSAPLPWPQHPARLTRPQLQPPRSDGCSCSSLHAESAHIFPPRDVNANLVFQVPTLFYALASCQVCSDISWGLHTAHESSRFGDGLMM